MGFTLYEAMDEKEFDENFRDRKINSEIFKLQRFRDVEHPRIREQNTGVLHASNLHVIYEANGIVTGLSKLVGDDGDDTTFGDVIDKSSEDYAILRAKLIQFCAKFGYQP